MELLASRPLSQLEKQGVIQGFEYTYELGWKLLADYLQWQGESEIAGPRDAIRDAFKAGLIADGDGWMAMLQDRNRTSHTYNEQTAEQIMHHIVASYHRLFGALNQRMQAASDKAD